MRKSPSADEGRRPESTVTTTSVVLSAGLLVLLLLAYVRYESQLALAQAADSLLDVATALALGYAVALAARPADEDHHFGHHSAEPIAALFTAMLAGALGVSVAREAIDALLSGGGPRLDWPLAAAFGAKVVAKSALSQWAAAVGRASRSSAMRAIAVDARNDVLVGVVGLAGFVSARYGAPQIDAWLALPVAVWIGYSGLDLGMENVRLLMGEAPDRTRQDDLLRAAETVTGVLGAHDLRARWHGSMLSLWIQIRVDPNLTVQAAHDIGEAVERRLLEEPDVTEAVAHVDVA